MTAVVLLTIVLGAAPCPANCPCHTVPSDDAVTAKAVVTTPNDADAQAAVAVALAIESLSKHAGGIEPAADVLPPSPSPPARPVSDYSYAAAYERAKNGPYRLLVLLVSEGCIPCKKLVDEHLMELSSTGILAIVDREKDPNARALGVSRWPAPVLLVYEPDIGGALLRTKYLVGDDQILAWCLSEKKP